MDNDIHSQGGPPVPDGFMGLSPESLPQPPVFEPAERLNPGVLRKLINDAGVTDLFDTQLLARLCQTGKLDPPAVAAFVNAANAEHKDLSAHALTLELTSENELAAITADLYGMEPVVLSEVGIEEDIALLITPEQATSWRVLPYGRDSLSNLLVASADPRDMAARQNLQQVLPRENILWRIAMDAELSLALDRVYRDASSASAVSESIAQVAAEAPREERLTVRDADSGIIKLVNSIIQRAQKEDASDIHIEPKQNHTDVRFRVDGVLRIAMRPLPKGDTTNRVIARIKNLSGMKADEKRRPQDGRVTLRVGENKVLDMRVVTVPTIYGEQVTMRLLDQRRAMLTLEQLGMGRDNLARYEAAIGRSHGCAIITGPTGSGKSTTLYSSVVSVVTPDRKFISIEDPVEYRLDGITQIDVSGHGEGRMDFAAALKSTLRSDPDVVLVGEIRDKETALTAVEAALTGHFLYTTLHTNDALSAITRLSRLGIEPYLVAESVAVLVAQRLLRRLCSECKIPYQATKQELELLHAPDWLLARAAGGAVEICRAREGGCNSCRKTGYHGRTGVYEVVTMTEELRALIHTGSSQDEMETYARASGMHSLRHDAFIRVAAGITSLDELARVVS